MENLFNLLKKKENHKIKEGNKENRLSQSSESRYSSSYYDRERLKVLKSELDYHRGEVRALEARIKYLER